MENQKHTVLLNKHTLLDDIQRFVLEKKHILLITSTPSISTIIKNKIHLKNVYEVTGANNNEFKQIVEHIKDKNIDVLILGIEQLLNEVKRSIIIEYYNYVDVIMVDNIHHISQTNFDYRPEYENIQLLNQVFNTSEWLLYAYTLDQSEFQDIQKVFPSVINKFTEVDIHFDYHEFDEQKSLAYVLSLAEKHSIVCISHNYLFAEIFANQMSRFNKCDPIHRKVEETKKVASTIAWQNSLLSSIVITSDTILPYPYPQIEHVVWLEMPVSKQQVHFYHQLFQAHKTLLVFNKENYSSDNVFIHQFAYNKLLNDVVKLIKESSNGLSLREVERSIDGESYVLEKAMKGLKAFKALKKQKLAYVIDQPWQLTSEMIQKHTLTKMKDFDEIYTMLHDTKDNKLIVNPEIVQAINNNVLAVRPKVLFPVGFYNSSLIKKEHQSDIGYVFYKDYDDINERANAIKSLLENLDLSNKEISLTCLCKDNDFIEQLMYYFSNKYNITNTKIFASFDSESLKKYYNPYHKMSCILSQFKLIGNNTLKSTTLVLADHGDHFWHMGVVAKALLENNLTKRVIVVFNQP